MRIHRIYCRLNLNKRRRGKKRLTNRAPVSLSAPETVNGCWSLDLMCDSLFCGRRFRTLNIVDDFGREALAIEIEVGLSAERVVRGLDRVVAWCGYPSKLRMDNGPILISTVLADRAEDHTVDLEFIPPGKPTQNGYIERFNQTYRAQVLNMYVFKTLSEVRAIIEEWLVEYNQERPHEALGDRTPFEFQWAHQLQEKSNLDCP